jgi:hypothetical protein
MAGADRKLRSRPDATDRSPRWIELKYSVKLNGTGATCRRHEPADEKPADELGGLCCHDLILNEAAGSG